MCKYWYHNQQLLVLHESATPARIDYVFCSWHDDIEDDCHRPGSEILRLNLSFFFKERFWESFKWAPQITLRQMAKQNEWTELLKTH